MDTEILDGAADSSTATTDPTLNDDREAGGGTPDGDQSVPFNEHPRWKQVLSQRDSYKQEAEAYRALGSPEHIEAVMEEVRHYRGLMQEARAQREAANGGPKTDEEKALQAQITDAKATLKKIAPEVFEAVEDLQRLKEERKQAQEYAAQVRAATDAMALRALGTLMAHEGMETDDEAVAEMADHLVVLANRDPELRALYLQDPKKTVKLAFDKYLEQSTKRLARRQGAAAQSKGAALLNLPKAGQGRSGSPSGGTGGQGYATINEAFRALRGPSPGKG